MSTRRIVITPLLTLLGLLLIAGIIATGRHARLAALEPSTDQVATDSAHAEELTRIRLQSAMLAQCSPTGVCLGLWRADLLDRAAGDIAAWPARGAFPDSRRAASRALSREAELIRLRARADMDGVRSPIERAVIARAADAWATSTTDLISARQNDKLMSTAVADDNRAAIRVRARDLAFSHDR